MNPIWAFFKTIRILNLMIVAATMYAMRYFIEEGFLRSLESKNIQYHDNVTSDFHFLLLTLIMVFLAASGNLINDYFDVKVDRINKPERITIGKSIKRRVAMAAHHTLNLLSVALGIYLGWIYKEWFYAFTPIAIASALWFYSFYLKKTFLLGNILVSVVVGIVPFWATFNALTEPFSQSISSQANSFHLSQLYIFFAFTVIAYAIQAYMITLFREIVKDAEDVKGDKEFGYRTMPIIWGWNKTRKVLIVSQVLWFLVLLKISHYIAIEAELIWGVLFMLIIAIPFLMSIISLRSMDIKKAHFTRASFWLKVTMAGGLLFSLAIPELMDSFLQQIF